MKYLFAATVPLLLAGCSLLQSMNGTSVNETLHYQCGTTKLTVTQNNKQDNVSFIMDGKQLTLPQVRAASGPNTVMVIILSGRRVIAHLLSARRKSSLMIVF